MSLLEQIGGLFSDIAPAVGELYGAGQLQNAAERFREEARGYGQEAMGLTQFQPFTVRTTTGGAFGYDPSAGEVTMTVSPEEQAMQQRLFGGAGGFYGQAMMPTAAREADVYERIRAIQSPEEQRQRLALEERLANQGRLGVRTAMFGGAPEQFALAQAQEEARNRAALSAIQQAQAEQMQQAQLGQQFLGASYLPQAQLMNVQQASQFYPSLAQQGRLYGTGLLTEASLMGAQAPFLAEQAAANLYGQLAAGVTSGAGGLLGGILEKIFPQETT